jgi:hypothetical protein
LIVMSDDTILEVCTRISARPAEIIILAPTKIAFGLSRTAIKFSGTRVDSSLNSRVVIIYRIDKSVSACVKEERQGLDSSIGTHQGRQPYAPVHPPFHSSGRFASYHQYEMGILSNNRPFQHVQNMWLNNNLLFLHNHSW